MLESPDAALVECPGCQTILKERLEKCFRCEADLSRWWPLEDAIRTAAAGPGHAQGVSSVRRNEGSRWPILIAIGVLGCVVGAGLVRIGWMGRHQVNPVTPETRMSGTTQPSSIQAVHAGEPFVLYRVQTGDSLWRIAAAFTGDGNGWASLFPEYVGRERELRVGAVLSVNLQPQDGVKTSKP